jgi:hypothetical protein
MLQSSSLCTHELLFYQGRVTLGQIFLLDVIVLSWIKSHANLFYVLRFGHRWMYQTTLTRIIFLLPLIGKICVCFLAILGRVRNVPGSKSSA